MLSSFCTSFALRSRTCHSCALSQYVMKTGKGSCLIIYGKVEHSC